MIDVLLVATAGALLVLWVVLLLVLLVLDEAASRIVALRRWRGVAASREGVGQSRARSAR